MTELIELILLLCLNLCITGSALFLMGSDLVHWRP